MGDESLLRLAKRIYRKTRSHKSVETYVKAVLLFTKFLNVEKPMMILKSEIDWESVLNDWIDEMVANGLSNNTINTYFTGVKEMVGSELVKNGMA